MEATELRILGALAAGQNVGPESSMLKTRGTELQQAVTELALEITGHYAAPLDQSTRLPMITFNRLGQRPLTVSREISTPEVSICGIQRDSAQHHVKLVLGL